MRKQTQRMALVRHRAAAAFLNRSVMALTLVAFIVQSFVVQTHIHFTPEVEKVLAALHPAKLGGQPVGAASGPHDKYPANEDPANCPICQEILYAGNYVTPAATALLLPALSVSIIALAPQAPVPVAAPSHNWQGRAPPTV